jgi:hypothetical protein
LNEKELHLILSILIQTNATKNLLRAEDDIL